MNTRRKDREGHYTGETNPAPFTNSSMLSMLRPSGSFEKYMAVKFYFLFIYLFLKDELFMQRFKRHGRYISTEQLLIPEKEKHLCVPG